MFQESPHFNSVTECPLVGNPAWVEDTICCAFSNAHAMSTIMFLVVKPTAANERIKK